MHRIFTQGNLPTAALVLAVVFCATSSPLLNLARAHADSPVRAEKQEAPPELISGLTVEAPGAGFSSAGLHLAAVGVDNSANLRTKGAQWSDWQTIGGTVLGAPALVGHADGRLDVLVRGGNNALFQRTQINGAWGGWTSLGGTLNSAPSATSSGPGVLDVAMTGADGRVYVRQWKKGAWGAFTKVSDQPVFDSPALVSPEPGRMELFVRGVDNKIYQSTWRGEKWTPFAALDNVFSWHAPVAAVPGKGKVALATKEYDHQAKLSVFNGTTWTVSPSILEPGPVLGSVALASKGDGVLEVFFRAKDNQIYHVSREVKG